MLLSPNEDVAFTNSWFEEASAYKSYCKDADQQSHTFFSVVLQRLIFPKQRNDDNIPFINNTDVSQSIGLWGCFCKKQLSPLWGHAMTSKQIMISVCTDQKRLVKIVKYSSSAAAASV